jgi:hypothetical protein
VAQKAASRAIDARASREIASAVTHGFAKARDGAHRLENAKAGGVAPCEPACASDIAGRAISFDRHVEYF